MSQTCLSIKNYEDLILDHCKSLGAVISREFIGFLEMENSGIDTLERDEWIESSFIELPKGKECHEISANEVHRISQGLYRLQETILNFGRGEANLLEVCSAYRCASTDSDKYGYWFLFMLPNEIVKLLYSKEN